LLADEADLEGFVDSEVVGRGSFSGADSATFASVLVAGVAAFAAGCAAGCVLGEEADVEGVVPAGLGAELPGLAVSGVATGAGIAAV